MQKELGYLIAALGLSVLAVAPIDGHPFPLDPRLRLLTICLTTVWCCVRLRAFMKARKRWSQWQRSESWSVMATWLPLESTNRWLPRGLAKALYRCLPEKVAGWLYPDRGILLGRAFQWSPEHTQELETFMRERAAPLPTGTDMRGGYPALHAVGMKKERPLVLPWSELVGHVLIGGTTRSGKTRLLEVILSEAIRGPGTVIVIDPKGDAELLMRAASQARRMKRDFAFFSPAFPEQSSTFNPFSTCTTTTELASRVQALMPGGGAMARDPFFTEYPLAIIERLGAAQKAVGDIWTIESLNAVTTLVPPLEALIARYLYEVVLEGEDTLPPLGELVPAYEALGRRDLLADALLDDWGKPRDHFQKVTANLTPAFRGVTGDRMGPLLSSTEPELTWESIVEERKVVYFSMNSLMFSEVSNRIGRVILQDLIGFLGRRYAYDEPAKMTPVTILIDEFSNVAYPGFIDALNKGGGGQGQLHAGHAVPGGPGGGDGKGRHATGARQPEHSHLVPAYGRQDGQACNRRSGPHAREPRADRLQPGVWRRQGPYGECRRRPAAHGKAAGSSGVADGHAERRGLGQAQGRELEAARAAARCGVEEGTARGGRGIQAWPCARGTQRRRPALLPACTGASFAGGSEKRPAEHR